MNIFLIYFLSFFTSSVIPNNDKWEYLFNGKNLEGWEIKIRGHELGKNYKNTFKVKDGSLKV